jgi:type II secretory pathway predicted ATPase ExeA
MAHVERDPFSNTADAAAYIPRTATESALVGLEMALRDGARVVCLDGPSGSGKTLLLHVLEERLAGDFSVLRVPYPKLDAEEFCRWGLAALREPARADCEQALAERIVRDAVSGAPPLVWIVDDADCLPLPTLHTLLRVQRIAGEALRLLLARSGELPVDQFAQVGVLPVRIELEGEMDSEETAHYVHARLDHVGADPAQRARIEASLDRLYAGSHGNPGRLHAAAAVLLCFGPDRLRAMEDERTVAVCGAGRAEEIAVDADAPERVSIESLVAEAVAAEPPEEIAPPEPAAERAPEPEPEPVRAPEAPSADVPQSPAPRRRHRLRRLGRR